VSHAIKGIPTGIDSVSNSLASRLDCVRSRMNGFLSLVELARALQVLQRFTFAGHPGFSTAM
jgi:hypothetical protein